MSSFRWFNVAIIFVQFACGQKADQKYVLRCTKRIQTDPQMDTESYTNLCTHIILNTINVNGREATLEVPSDFKEKYRPLIAAYKNKGIKVMPFVRLIEQQTEQTGIIGNEEKSKRLIENIVKFLEENNFDGIAFRADHSWNASAGYTKLIEELSRPIRAKGLLFGIESFSTLLPSFNIPELFKHIDCMLLLQYITETRTGT